MKEATRKDNKSLGKKIAWAVGIIAVIIYLVTGVFQARKFENGIFAQKESMQNTWAMMSERLKMEGFTVKNYPKSFIDAIEANAKRYANDKNAMMKWVTESKSQLSDKAYLKFMDTISKVYAAKESKQLNKISFTQLYRDWLGTTLHGNVTGAVFSFPTEKALKIMDTVIVNKETQETFETGIETTKNPFE